MFLKKKLLSFISGLSIFAIIGSCPVLGADLAFVNGDNVNVRLSPSTESDVLAKYSNGEILTVLAADGDWFKIETESIGAGFISKEFIQVVSVDGTVNGDGVNFRKSASADGEVLSQLDSGAALTVNAINGDFYSVNYQGADGYIHKDFVSGQNLAYLTKESPAAPAQETGTYAVIESDNGLKLRKSPSTDAEVLSVLPYKSYADLIEEGGEWHKVGFNGAEGYISSEFTTKFTGVKPQSSRGQEVIAFARQFLGTPYRWAGTDLNNGVDCSGFVYSVMKNFGVSLNRSSRDMVNNGSPVDKSNLQTGDLVFFDTSGGNNSQISHVGIYIGNGDFIHSSSSRTMAVMISNLSEDYYIRTYVSACRVL